MPLEKILEKALYYDGAFYLLHLIFCLRLGGAFCFLSIFITVKLFYHNGGAGSIENGVCPPRKMMWFLPNIAQGGNRGPRKAQAQKAPRRGGDSPPAHNPSVSFADSSPYTGEPCVFRRNDAVQAGIGVPEKRQAQQAARRGSDSPPANNPSVSFADSSPYTGEPCVFAEMTLFRRAIGGSPKSASSTSCA